MLLNLLYQYKPRVSSYFNIYYNNHSPFIFLYQRSYFKDVCHHRKVCTISGEKYLK